MKSKQIQPEYNEKGVRYMMCNCGSYIAVGDLATNVICGTCTNIRMMVKFLIQKVKTYTQKNMKII